MFAPEVARRMSLKGMNDTMASDGLVHTLLVVATLTTLPITTSTSPPQRPMLAALRTAGEEMSTLVAAQPILWALGSRIPPATRYLISHGDKARVYRERSSRWEGPFVVLRVEAKQAHVADRNGSVRHVGLAQLLPEPTPCDERALRYYQDGLRNMHIHPPASDSSMHFGSGIQLTETLHPADPRGKSGMFDEAKKEELKV